MVMTYDVADGFRPMKKLKAHPTTIWQMDFSLDSQTLIHDGGVYYDLMTGKHNPKGPSAFKDETWHTWSLRTGWPVQGIWPQGNDCNTVARSPDGKTLAAGDDFGFVKLYKYPCPVPKSSHHKYTGHSSHVTNLMFTKNTQGQQYLISTGGMDKCIF
jgi:WD40 repeat protein